jgi:Gas vesicle synthesis protein GvpL/GvpF
MSDAYYVYAIVTHDSAVPAGLAGFHGRPVELIAHGNLAAAATLVDPTGLQPSTESVLTHEEVVERLGETVPLLPVRFGTVFADKAGVVAVLAKQYDTLLADLLRLGDKVEFGLTVLWPGSESDAGEDASVEGQISPPHATSDPPGPGTQYLRARVMAQRRDAARRARAQELSDFLEAQFAPFTLNSRRTILPTPRIAVRAAYLLHPRNVEAYHEAFERSRKTHPEVRFLLNGPWPPYSFVSASGDKREASPVEESGSTGPDVQEEVVHG